jgi:RIH domain
LDQINEAKNVNRVVDNEVAGKLFTELVDNNEKILDGKINSDTIKNIVRFITEDDRDKKYVKILRALCICDSKGVLKNQTQLTNLILSSQETSQYFIFKVEVEEEDILLSFPALAACKSYSKRGVRMGQGKDTKIPLKQLQTESEALDGGKSYSYFIELIHFLADLCYEGFTQAIKWLQRIFDFEILLDILNSEDKNYEIKDAFCHLFTNLWVDLPEYTKLKVDLTTVEWDRLKDNYTFPTLDIGDLLKFKPIKYYVSQTISYHFIDIDLQKPETVYQVSFLNSIIHLAWKMMELGLYNELREINSLVKGLKKVLKNSYSQNHIRQDLDLISLEKMRSSYSFRKEIIAKSYDGNIAAAKMRECRISICYFFEYISRIQIMLKQYTLIFRLKNTIATSCNSLTLDERSQKGKRIHEPDSNYKAELKYQGIHVDIPDMVSKFSFLVKDMNKKDEFVKSSAESQSTRDLVAVLLSMSFDKHIKAKTTALNLILSLFSNCLYLTESISKVTCVERPMKDYNDYVNNLRTSLVATSIQFKSMTEVSMETLYITVRQQMENLFDHTADQLPIRNQEMVAEPEGEEIVLSQGVKVDIFDSYVLFFKENSVSATKQDIVRGSGLLELLISFLGLTLQYPDRGASKLDIQLRETIFKLLNMLLIDNEDNQFIALKKLDTLWPCFFLNDTTIGSLMCLESIVSNFKKLLFDEKLSASIIQAITYKLKVEDRKQENYIHKCLVYINVLAKCCEYSGNPIKRNQSTIIKGFIDDGRF